MGRRPVLHGQALNARPRERRRVVRIGRADRTPGDNPPIVLDATRMLTPAVGLVLLAALLHASWNAMLHGNRDRFLSMTWMSIAIAVVATVFAIAAPRPAAAAWPYIVASGLLHIVYNMTLVWAYRDGDLGQAYPIARGSSPLLVTLGAGLFAREPIGPLHALGIAMISGGIVALALDGQRMTRGAALAALATGATIAAYTVVDGLGVRSSGGEALAYTAWMFLFYWLMPVLFVAVRGRRGWSAAVRSSPAAVGSSLVGGLVSIAAYGIVIWAMQAGAMGAVSALRETSVVFAVLIGRFFLHEPVSVRRWAACSIVAAGAICLGL
jgi:drug/metabolite transporter (DMT)-like permease